MKQSWSWLRFDFLLFFTVLALIGVGLAMIYSVTSAPAYAADGLLHLPVFEQGLVSLFGVIFILFMTAIDYETLGFHPFAILSPITRQQQEPEGLGLTLHHEQYSKVERDDHEFSLAAPSCCCWKR